MQDFWFLEMFRHSPDLLLLLRIEAPDRLVAEQVNLALEEVLEQKASALLDRSPREWLPLAIADVWDKHCQECIQTEQVLSYEHRWDFPGRSGWFQIVFRPLKDSTGRVCRVFLRLRDITEYKETAFQLSLLEEKYGRAFRSSPIGLLILRESDRRLLEVNSTWNSISDTVPEQCLGRTFAELPFRFAKDEMERLLEQYFVEGQIREQEVVFLLPSGYRRTCLVSANRLDLLPERCALWTFLDITQRKRTEYALRESEARFRSYFELPLIGIGILQVHLQWFEVNSRLCDLLGYSAEELTTKFWFTITHPEDVAQEQILLDRVLTGKSDGYSLDKRLVRRDGSILPVAISLRSVRSVHNLIDFFIVVVQDISQRKEAEQEIHRLNLALQKRVEERTIELETANREMEAFCFAVSHDLRAPLRSIDGFSQALQEDYGSTLPPEAQDYLRRIRHSTSRMDKLLGSLLELSRVLRSCMQRQTVDLSKLAELYIQNWQRQNPNSQIHWSIQPSLKVEGDPGLLRIALEQLLANAVKFSSRRPDPQISFGALDQNGERVYYLRDNGVGFDPTYKHKLFSLFQRLHRPEEFEGTGVGLALVQRIIHRHGGKIWAEGNWNHGATFYFQI